MQFKMASYHQEPINEEDQSLKNARRVLREAEEWQEMFKKDCVRVERSRRTTDIYEVLGAVGKEGSEIQNTRIKQLIRERIKDMDFEVKNFVAEKQPVLKSVADSKPISTKSTSGKTKFVATPLPRVAFLGPKKVNRVNPSTGPGPIRIPRSGLKDDVQLRRETSSTPRRLSQLLETPKKTLSTNYEKLFPVPPVQQYFHPILKKENIEAAYAVVPACQILRRQSSPTKTTSATRSHVRRRRQNNVAVMNVESTHRPRKHTDILQIQVLPSVNVESQIIRRTRKEPNVKLINLTDQKNNEFGVNKSPDVVNDQPYMKEIGTSPKRTVRFTPRSPTQEDSTQTNGDKINTTENDYLKHLVLNLVEKGLSERLQNFQDASTETKDLVLESLNVSDRFKSVVTQTSPGPDLSDKETSYSEVEPVKEYRDVAVCSDQKDFANAQVQVDFVQTVSTGVSPVQELLPVVEDDPVSDRPILVDCGTSPLPTVFEEEEEETEKATFKPRRKPIVKRLLFQESSSSSYLTDTTSTSTGTTTTTTSTGEEAPSEGELIFKIPRIKVEAVQSLSEGEIPPEMTYSTRSDLNATLSEGQVTDLNSTGQTAISDTPDSEVLGTSVGEVAPSPTDDATSS